MVFDWLAAQLRRPVERWEWSSRWRRTSRLWRLADDGDHILGDVRARRLSDEERPPARVLRLR
ncbi:hypothetical protein ACI797_04475 [Geodermatophilus sp. SYSU D00691]